MSITLLLLLQLIISSAATPSICSEHVHINRELFVLFAFFVADARNNITPCDWIIKCSSPLLYVHQQQQRLTADGQTKRLLLHLQQSVLQILRGARAFRSVAAGKVVSVCMRLFYMRAAAAATFSREKPLLNKRTVSAWCILQPTNDHQLVFKRVQRTKPHSVCVCVSELGKTL